MSPQQLEAEDTPVIARFGLGYYGGEMNSAAWSPVDPLIFTSHVDGSLRGWDLEKASQRVVLSDAESYGWKAVFSADGAMLATGRWPIKVFSVESLEETLLHGSSLREQARVPMVFDAKSQRLFSCSWSGRVLIWDSKESRVLGYLPGKDRRLHHLVTSKDGKYLLGASGGGVVTIWNLETRLKVLGFQAHEGSVKALSASSGERLLTVSGSGLIRQWDLTTGVKVGADIAMGSQVVDAHYQGSSGQIWSLSHDGRVRVWEGEGGIRTVVEASEGCLTFMAKSPDGRHIALGNKDGFTYILDTENLESQKEVFRFSLVGEEHKHELSKPYPDRVEGIQMQLFLGAMRRYEVMALELLFVENRNWGAFARLMSGEFKLSDLKTLKNLFDEKTSYMMEAVPQGDVWDRLWLTAKRSQLERGTDILSAAARVSLYRLRQLSLDSLFVEEVPNEVIRDLKQVEEGLEVLRPGTSIVRLSPQRDQLVVSVQSSGGNSVQALSVFRRDVFVIAMHLALEMRGEAEWEALRPYCAMLYQVLIRPLEEILPEGDAIVFIPEGPLRLIPFSVLWNEEDKRFLIEERALAIAPSAERLYLPSGGQSVEFERELLLLADPDGTAGLGSLPLARKEADNLKKLYPSSLVLTDHAATRERLCAEAGRSRIVQLSTHAVFDWRSPNRSKLVLAPDDSNARGFLSAEEIASCDFSGTELVVLAGCATAVQEPSGEGSLSLVEPFLNVGVPAVVATHWVVADEEAMRFSVAFHESLRAGAKPIVAMREAQLGLLRSMPDNDHRPSSWASFSLYLGSLEHFNEAR